jgi:cobalt/nickel transport system permease protein
MHISEGVLSLPVLAGGAAFALAGLGYSLKKLPWKHIMSVGILSAAFFVSSLIHVPLGPGSVHLIMNGLLGAILGWAAFAAIAVALFLQALLFQFGGLTSLGVNICIMGFPAVLSGLTFRRFFAGKAVAAQGSNASGKAAAFACGALAVLGSALLCALALCLSGDVFFPTAWAILLAHLPIMMIEGLLTAAIVSCLTRMLPELLSPDALP